MPILAPIEGFPFCQQEDYDCGDGVNMALWNELADTIRFELHEGIDLIHARPNTSNYNNANAERLLLMAIQQASYATIGAGAVIDRMSYQFEIMPGWDQFRFFGLVQLPAGSLTNTNPGPGQNANIIDQQFSSLKFTINNITQGTSSIIGHFFTNANAYNAYAATYGLPSIATDPIYINSIGVSETLLNYYVDIPTNVLPIGATSDQAELIIEHIGINAAPGYVYRISAYGTNYSGVKFFKFSGVMQCQ